MTDKVQSYFRINGKHVLPIDDKFIKDLLHSPVPNLSPKLGKALKVASRHGIGLLVDMNTDTGVVQCLPMSKEAHSEMREDEAIVLAAELHHIFENNPNFYKWPVKLAKGCSAYSYRSIKDATAQMVTLILNEKGMYLTSYDPVHNEFYPEVHGISTRPLAKYYPQFLDEFNNMYRRVRSNIEQMRAEEADKPQEQSTESGDISR
jgi:hypothetical protein